MTLQPAKRRSQTQQMKQNEKTCSRWKEQSKNRQETETPILWPPDVKSWVIWKDLDAGKDWGQEEKGTTEDEMVGWHHRLNGHGFGWTLGDGQGSLACCGSWGCKESDTTERPNWTELNSKWRGIGTLPKKEFRVMVVKMIQNFRNLMEAQISRMEADWEDARNV